jgi:hypothetical protein
VNAGFDKYCDGWPSVRLMNSIAQKYVDEANAKCEEEGNLRAEAVSEQKRKQRLRLPKKPGSLPTPRIRIRRRPKKLMC